MSVPANLRYTPSHEWIRTEADGTVSIGITDHAQELLGDIVFIELPRVGRVVKAAEACATVESVKAASDIYAPIAGEIVAVNQPAADTPDSVNATPYDVWFFTIKPTNAADVEKLLDAKAYEASL